MTQTPIQELIHWLEEWNYNEAAYHAKKVFLKKEKEFVGEVFEAGERNARSENGVYYAAPNKDEFLYQLYPDK